jgi:hypothetical protein
MTHCEQKKIYNQLNLLLDKQEKTFHTINNTINNNINTSSVSTNTNINTTSNVSTNTNNTYLEIPDEISLLCAKIVDYKVIKNLSHHYILYNLQITNINYDTVYCWKRYSDFDLLYNTLIKQKGFTKSVLPALPKKYIFGNFKEKNINCRITDLNNFLLFASTNDKMQWGIKVNDNINVYKRRIKTANELDLYKPE